ncbi:MAG: caspase family protein [Actinomycetota bacterium]|nr:caspase family protein [Actinomycetota bacterium]
MSDGTYKALLVGNSTFPNDAHNLQSLEGPVNDISVLRDALTDPEVGLFEPTAVRMLPERTMSEILIELETFFGSATRDDCLLLYYSGHGLLTDENRLLLCARDTRTDLVKSTSVSATAINDMIESSPAQTTIIVLDCCYSGAFKGADLPDSLKGNGRFLLTSTRSGQLANDATRRNGTSQFTQHLVDGLLNAVPDTNGDGYVELGEIYDYVHARLVSEGRQIPQRSFAGGGGVAVARRPRELRAEEGQRRSEFELSQANLEIDDVDPGESLPPEQIYVLTAPGATCDYSVSTEAEWLEVEPHEGYFSVVLHPVAGTNRANVVVRDRQSGVTRTMRVRVRVGPPGAPPEPSSGSGAPPVPLVPAEPVADETSRGGAKAGRAREPRRPLLRRLRGRSRTLAVVGSAVVVVLAVVAIVVTTRSSGMHSGSTIPVGGPGPATLYQPTDVVAAGDAVYVNDMGHGRIRRIGSEGGVTTVAGKGGDDPARGGGSPATSTSISVSSMAADSAGNLYLALGSGGGIVKLAPDGITSTVPIVLAGETKPTIRWMAVAPDGRLVMSVGSGVFKLQPGGGVDVVAGSGVEGYTGDGAQASDARLRSPKGIVVDGEVGTYIADSGNNRVRLVKPDGSIITVAGDGTSGSSGRGGPATAASVSSPEGLALDDKGNLYIASSNQLLKVTKADGVLTVVAGSPDNVSGFSGDGGLAIAALLKGPVGVARDSAGNLYVSESDNNRVRRITPDGRISTIG